MADHYRPVINVRDLERQPYQNGELYEAVDGYIADVLALTQIGAVYTELPPGKSACPFHVHHVEDELFVVLEGEGEYRFGDEVYPVRSGDLLGAPRGGPEFAHKLTNTGPEVLRYIAISSKSDTEICEYPDSGKFMVRRNNAGPYKGFHFVGRDDMKLDYWDGEET